jgi:hypothetical protein
MKKTPWRRIAVTSSLNEISTDQLGEVLIRPSITLSAEGFWTDICKDDVNGFPSTSDICFLDCAIEEGRAASKIPH